MLNTKALHAVLFVSRNKDNDHVESFVERKKSFLSETSMNDERLKKKFQHFVEDGLDGEMSRCYISVNEINNEKTVKALQHYLLDMPDMSIAKLPQKVTSLAMRVENAKTKKWLFDFDEDKSRLDEFLKDVEQYDVIVEKVHATPNGFAVIVNHGFDTRELLEKWGNVELKRNSPLCLYWDKK